MQVWDRVRARLLWHRPLSPGDIVATEARLGLAFSPRGDRLVVATPRGPLVAFDAASGHALSRFEGHTAVVQFIAFTRDGNTLVTAGVDHDLRVWNVERASQRWLLVGHALAVTGLRIDEAHGRAISTSGDGSARVWDLATGQELAVLRGHRGGLTGVVLAASHAITFGKDGTIREWDVERAQALRAFVTPDNAGIDEAGFSPAGDELVLELKGLVVQGWSLRTEQPTWRVAIPHDRASDLQLLVDAHARRVLVEPREAEETLEVWSIPDPQRVSRIIGAPIWTSVISADGSRVLSGQRDGGARLWDSASGRLLRSFDAHTKNMVVTLSPDGRIALTGGDERVVELWDTETGQLLRVLSGHTAGIQMIAISSDGERIATASLDRTARVWSAATGAQLASFEHADVVEAVALSPDPSIVATVSGGQVRLWGTQSERLLEVEDAKDELYSGLRFSPDGRLLLSTTAGDVFKLRAIPKSNLDPAALAAAIACRVPFRLKEGRLTSIPQGERGCPR